MLMSIVLTFNNSIECLYVQMLLYPFDEQLNLPFLSVQLVDSNASSLKLLEMTR